MPLGNSCASARGPAARFQEMGQMGSGRASCPASPAAPAPAPALPPWGDWPGIPAVARGILALARCTLACVPHLPLPGDPRAVGGRGPGSCEDACVEGSPLGGPDSDCLAAMDSLGWCVLGLLLGLVHRGSGGHPVPTRHPVLGAGRGRGRDAFGVVAALVTDGPARPGVPGTRDGGRSRGRDPRLNDCMTNLRAGHGNMNGPPAPPRSRVLRQRASWSSNSTATATKAALDRPRRRAEGRRRWTDRAVRQAALDRRGRVPETGASLRRLEERTGAPGI